MRLIDADALTEKYGDWYTEEGAEEGYIGTIKGIVESMPTIEERTKGKWIEKHHAYSDEEKAIEEWQSCQCSVCGRYDTRPYMYYFDEPNFCSWCGADMRGEGNGNE